MIMKTFSIPVHSVSLDRSDLHLLGPALLRDVRLHDERRLRRLPAVPARPRSQFVEILQAQPKGKSLSVER
jgi:hypothetical protein